MTTAEKVAIGVAIATALGLGTLISLLVGHLLNRREKKINIAEKAVQVADTMMTRLTDSLDRVQEELAVAKRENEELRLELEKTRAASVEESERLRGVERSAQSADKALHGAQHEVSSLQNLLTVYYDDHLKAWDNSSLRLFLEKHESMKPRLGRVDWTHRFVLPQRPDEDEPPEVSAKV
ncbi:hypothetical protein Pen02_73190 [Plantactinospora endophytica]|uniref:Uncharacterized protein n=1 Tax=Plantactinospora endophytica TaxID=673535 RepID=A0ABQ4ECC9_9ACTN|nr:hypothetical protein Pen02_73190 [Plantactinospora endophytica]